MSGLTGPLPDTLRVNKLSYMYVSLIFAAVQYGFPPLAIWKLFLLVSLFDHSKSAFG